MTFPLDLTKTRLMIQGERGQLSKVSSAGQPAYRGMMKTAIGIGWCLYRTVAIHQYFYNIPMCVRACVRACACVSVCVSVRASVCVCLLVTA